MTLEQIIPLVTLIGGAIGLIILLWRFAREKPRLNAEVLTCKHRVRSDHNATHVRLEFRVHNRGDKPTTLTKLGISFLDWNGNPHTATENLKTDVGENTTTKNLEVLHTFYPTFQYAESFPCTFTLYHTHGKLSFKTNSEESSRDLSKSGFFV